MKCLYESLTPIDDALFRVATFVQMIGVLILTFGLPVSFSAAADGQSPNNILMVIGYVIMRVPLMALWLRAARQDSRRRQTNIAYSVVIGAAQIGWLLTAIVPLRAAHSSARVDVIRRGHCGAGLHIAALAVEDGHLSLLLIAVALAVPVAAVIVMIFVTWSVLLKSFDLTHLPLLIGTLIPLAAAIIVGAIAGSEAHINPNNPSDVLALVTVIGLVALSAVIEVVGHELVGSNHTIRAVKAKAA